MKSRFGVAKASNYEPRKSLNRSRCTLCRGQAHAVAVAVRPALRSNHNAPASMVVGATADVVATVTTT